MALNSPAKKLVRLLKLFPAQRIRSRWEPKKGKLEEQIPYIAESSLPGEIFVFSQDNFNWAHQHVRLYRCDDSLAKDPNELKALVLQGYNASKAQELEGGQFKAHYRLDLAYVVHIEPYERLNLEFFWPVMIHYFGNGIIAVKTVVIEKDVQSYLEEGQRELKSERAVSDDDLFAAFESAMVHLGTIAPVDVHKGIKSLWENDTIDSPSVRFKKARSTSSERMDQNYLLKRDAPDEYNEVVGRPLIRTLFRVLKPVGNEAIREYRRRIEQLARSKGPQSETRHASVAVPIKSFVVEPGKGFFSFIRYPENEEGADAIIRAVLEEND